MNISYPQMDTTPVIVVAIHGHVWIATGIKVENDHLHMFGARIVRSWGTTSGLNELVDGPTTSTVIDAPAPIVFIPDAAVIALIPCRAEAWVGKL